MTTVPPLIGTGLNMMNRKVCKTIASKDAEGQEIKYIVALYRGGACGPHTSQTIRIWYNYSPFSGRYKSSAVVFCALDMENKACEIYDTINNENDVQRMLAEPLILHTGKWW